MHDQQFSESLRPKRHFCLFLPLQPYSLGHEAELWRTENKLCQLSGEKFDKLPDAERKQALIMAVDICSQTRGEYADSEKILESQPSKHGWKDRKARRKKNELDAKWAEWTAHTDKLTPHDWTLATVDFRIYLNNGRAAMPTLYSGDEEHCEAYELLNGGEKLDKGRTPGSPMLAQLIEFAQRSNLAGLFRVESVFDVPFAGCANLFFAALESEGRMYVMNQAEYDQIVELKELKNTIRTENAAAQKAWNEAATDEQKRDVLKNHPRIFNISAEACKFAGEEALKQQEELCQR